MARILSDRKPKVLATSDNVNLPTSPSTASLSSSLSSSAASSMMAHISSSSQSSENGSFDHAAPSPPLKARLTSPAPRTSSLANIMGQSYSGVDSSTAAPAPPSPLPSSQPRTLAKGEVAFTLKRVFGGRKKAQEEVRPNQLPQFPPPNPPNAKNKGRDPPTALPLPERPQTAPSLLGAKLSPADPMLPPKPIPFQKPKNMVTESGQELQLPQRGSILSSSPTIAAALDFMRAGEANAEHDGSIGDTEKVTERRASAQSEQKDIWRKSDSTISHYTLRPNALAASRNSRPVSMAESFHSSHTVIASGRRLSALVTDVEFFMAEEEGLAFEDQNISAPPQTSSSARHSPTPSLRSRNRRSMSLSFSPHKYPPTRPPTDPTMSTSTTDPISRETDATSPYGPLPRHATWTAAVNPSGQAPSSQASGNHIRGRLTTWKATTHVVVSPPTMVVNLPDAQPPRPQQSSNRANGGFGFRQTAISITGGLAPAAGLAKRAVEKIGRAWGGMGSGFSGSHAENEMADPDSRQPSFVAHLNPRRRRTPNAPSGSWSMASQSSSTLADSESFSTTGPFLGKCLRGGLRLAHSGAGVGGGVVFGRPLRTCVSETAISRTNRGQSSIGRLDLEALEFKLLPALVVRAVQHVLLWGIQEEGLFRVSGRPMHVAKLRAVFDTGADYDMSECSPGELDPHAVASIFKAYLRELPEPILTDALIAYFEAAVANEINNAAIQTNKGNGSTPLAPRPPPRDALPPIRKPPSLSTLAMPSFSNMPPPSESLLTVLVSLLAQLPPAHRDLMSTVTQLIRVAAKHSNQTKMPLSNLLLVFCPSLSMSPQLLRVLCENESIWERMELGAVKPANGTIDAALGSRTSAEASPEGSEINRQTTDATNGMETEGIPEPFMEGRGLSAATLYLDAQESLEPCSPDISPVSQSPSPDEEQKRNHLIPDRLPTRSPASGSTFTSTDATSFSSSESLITPASSSGAQSSNELPVAFEEYTKLPEVKLHSPFIADAIHLPLPLRPRKPPISGPVQSLGAGSTPATPISSRISVPLLTIPDFVAPMDAPVSTHSSRFRGSKKPSLRLFARRSTTSLLDRSFESPVGSPSSPYSQNKVSSETSTSTPISALNAVTAPQSTVSLLPPVLDLQLNLPNLGLGLNTGDDHAKGSEGKAKHDLNLIDTAIAASVSSLSLASETPIADRFCAPLASPDASDRSATLALRSPSMVSVSSSASSYHRLSFENRDDDWTQSVLMAAHADHD